MKTQITSNGKKHTLRLTAENVFEQAAIGAVAVYRTEVDVSKDDTAKNPADPNKFDTLVITMEDK